MPKTYRTEIIGYTFSELNEKVQKRLWENDDYFGHEVDFDPIVESFSTDLHETFGADVSTLEVYYDISYSQGDGACCVGELDVDTVFENYVGTSFPRLLGLINSGRVTIDAIKVVRDGPWNFYNHENTCRVDVHYSCDSDKVGDWDGEDVTELEEMLTSAIREELINLYSGLRDHYEDSTSFEAYCEAADNGTIYTEDGNIVDPAFIRNAHVSDAVQLKLDFEDYKDYLLKTT